MKKSNLIYLVLIAITLFRCSSEPPTPEEPATRSFRDVTYEDIPAVINKLTAQL